MRDEPNGSDPRLLVDVGVYIGSGLEMGMAKQRLKDFDGYAILGSH